MKRPVFRGQANAKWMLESGAIRRLVKENGKDFIFWRKKIKDILAKYHKEKLILPMKKIDGKKIPDFERLSILQHLGAATGFIDFTTDLNVALWFACKDSHYIDGEIIIIDIRNNKICKNAKNIEHIEKCAEENHIFLYYEPNPKLGERIRAQKSVFIYSNVYLPLDFNKLKEDYFAKEIIRYKSKKYIFDQLKEINITETELFKEVPGLAMINSVNKPLRNKHLNAPVKYLNDGDILFINNQYEEAFNAYTYYEQSSPGKLLPHIKIGMASTALGKLDKGHEAFTKAIDRFNLDICNIIDDLKDMDNLKHNCKMSFFALHYLRGNLNAAMNKHREAIEDFKLALQHDITIDLTYIFYDLGNSYYAIDEFAIARHYFNKAWLIKENSCLALAKGNCNVILRSFEAALKCYDRGKKLDPEAFARKCRSNYDNLDKILINISGNNYQTSNNQAGDFQPTTVYIETTNQIRKKPIYFHGNRCNTGYNLLRMKHSHENMKFRVKIRSLDSS